MEKLSQKMKDGAVIPSPSLRHRVRWLVEVFSVSFETLDNIDGEDHCKLYGTIKLSRGLSTDYLLYDRKKEDYESIKAGEIITLTGPHPCIEAYRTFHLGLELWNYDNNEQVIRGDITLDFLRDLGRTLLSKKIDGIGCSLIVKYAVLSNAVEALVEVILISSGNGNDSANVFGYLAAQDNLLGQEVRLFRVSAEEEKKYVKVSPGEPIPLSRSMVVASVWSYLTIRAELYCEYVGHKIGNGRVNFTPEPSGTSTQNITGEYGKIEVKVTWIS